MFFVIFCGGTVLTLVFVIKWFRDHLLYRKQINRIPGPAGLPIVGNLFNWMHSGEDVWKLARKSNKKNYPIYREWYMHIAAVNLMCAEDFEIIMSSMNYTQKSGIYDLLHAWLGTGLLTSGGSKWQSRRKILTPAFHFNILQRFVPMFVEEADRLVKELEEECDKPYTNILPKVTHSTLQLISGTAMGTQLNKFDKNWKEYTTAIYRIGEIFLIRLTRLWYSYSLLYMFTSLFWEEKRLLQTVHNFTMKVISKRKSQFREDEFQEDMKLTGKKRLAMLDLLISAQNKGQAIDDNGIREEVDTFMFEGHDTTSACVSFTLLLLANHPEIQEMVVDELRNICNGNLNHTLTYEDLKNMNYLERVIKESLRMFPSVPFISRECDEDIKTATGYVIPAHTMTHLHIFDLHYNEKYYREPEVFDPDRFLPENVQKRHPFAYLPFSAGPRNCIGQKFALLEVKSIIAATLKSYVLKSVDKLSDIIMVAHLILKTKSGIKINIRKRDNF